MRCGSTYRLVSAAGVLHVRRRRCHVAVLMVAGGMLGGCAAGPAEHGAAVSDSAGVRVVENYTPEWTDGAITVSEMPIIVIGSASGVAAQELFQVSNAYRLSDGRVLVLNGPELRLFSATGEHERTIGRAGSGPGEFRGPRWAAQRGDTLIVYDPFQDNGRVSYFTSAGDHLSDTRLTVTGMDHPSPNGMLPDGSYITERSEGSVDWTEAGYVSYTRAVIRFPRDGSRVDTIAVTSGGEMFREEFRGGMAQWDVPFGRRALTAQHGGRVFVGDGQHFMVDAYDADGTHVSSIRSPAEVRSVGDAEVKQWIDATLDAPFYQSRPEVAVSARERFQKTPAAAAMPAYDRLIADAAGGLWARLFAPPWETATRWRVFDAEGRWLSDVTLPGDLQVFEIGGDYVLGKRTDELGVEYVQLHALDIDRQGVTMPSMRTTSNAVLGTVLSVPSRSSSQRGSGAPLMYQPLPLSAMNIPYVLSAVRMTCTSDGKPEISKSARSRTRIPIGGRSGSVLLLAQCRAGGTYARRVVGHVNRSACRISPCSTASS